MSSIGELIAQAAIGFVRTPFRHRGRLPGRGLDCVGVPLCAAWAAGLAVPDFQDYPEIPDPMLVLQEIAKRADPVLGAAQLGDVLLLKPHEALAIHVAVWCGDTIVQANRSRNGHGRVLQTPLGHWGPRVHSRWRLRGAG